MLVLPVFLTRHSSIKVRRENDFKDKTQILKNQLILSNFNTALSFKISKQIEVIYGNRLVGRLALSKEGQCAFEYSAEWLNSGFSISPFELPLRNGVFIARPRPFEGGFGVFDDCLPDGWGLLVLDRYLQRRGINPRLLTLLDRLALVGSTGRGALEFRPNKSVISNQEYVDF